MCLHCARLVLVTRVKWGQTRKDSAEVEYIELALFMKKKWVRRSQWWTLQKLHRMGAKSEVRCKDECPRARPQASKGQKPRQGHRSGDREERGPCSSPRVMWTQSGVPEGVTSQSPRTENWDTWPRHNPYFQILRPALVIYSWMMFSVLFRQPWNLPEKSTTCDEHHVVTGPKLISSFTVSLRILGTNFNHSPLTSPQCPSYDLS